jgi:Concanavalin A-like lectin/glucanases superfamily
MKFNLQSLSSAVLFLILTFVGCQDPVQPPDINNSLPEITKISSSLNRTLAGDSIQVSVQANNGNEYSWTATGGSFADAKTNSTLWIAPSTGGNYTIVCTVSNSAGSNHASLTLTSVVVTLPQDVNAWWTFDKDFSEYISKDAGAGGDGVSIESDDAVQGLGAADFEGEDTFINSAVYSNATAKMGPDDDFTIAVWIKTSDENDGWIFGKTVDSLYVDGGKGLYIDYGNIVFDLYGIDEVRTDDSFNDGLWHHVSFVKTGTTGTIYVDGDEKASYDFGDWTDDGDGGVTIGSAWEEDGSDWPGTYQGLMDDVRFYQKALTADEIAAIAKP